MFDGLSLDSLHHAYVLVGQRDILVSALEAFLMQEGIRTKGNPDYHITLSDQFLLDDSHALIRSATMHAVAGKKFFVHAFSSVTHEAQNALLKILEEPPKGTHFFIIVPNASILLPTVRSRMIALSAESREGDATQAEAFIHAPIAKRLEMAKAIAADKTKVGAFFSELERYFMSHKKTATDLETLYRARVFARDRGSSAKMLVEYVALMLA